MQERQQSGLKIKNSIPFCSNCKSQYDSYYRIPRVIPKCGHTFCQKCINNCIQAKANRRVFNCFECQSETIIRKDASQTIPKNIVILDIVKNLKKQQYQQSSPSINKSLIGKQSPSKYSVTHCLSHPNKQLDLICQTCNYQKVCSICVLIGNNHQQHKFVEHIPASKIDLNQVKQVFTIIDDSVKEMILPNSQHNILKKAEQSLVNQLINSVKQHFREHYYKIIEKKQHQVINQVREIKFQGGVSNKIQQIAKHYDLLKIQFSDIFNQKANKQNASLQIVEDFIQRCKNLHNQIEIFSEHTQNQSKRLFHQISTKVSQSSLFRLTELPFSLKSLVFQKVQITSPTKNRIQSVNQLKKNKNSSQADLKQSRNTQRVHPKQQQEVKSVQNISFECQRKPFTANSINAKAKSSFLPPKHKINKFDQKNQRNQKKQEQIVPLLDLSSKLSDKKSSNYQNKASFNTERVNKTLAQSTNDRKQSAERSHNKLNVSQITKFQTSNNEAIQINHLKIKQIRPLKQIPLNLKSKYSAIIKQIVRQSQSSQSLQLIGMQINDQLIIHICQYLKVKKLSFSMIKLVKNLITDEGFSILLGHLVQDCTTPTQVLNLTSNQLTAKSLELIIEFGSKNSFLKTIYLSHNPKISSFNIKKKQKQLQTISMQIVM